MPFPNSIDNKEILLSSSCLPPVVDGFGCRHCIIDCLVVSTAYS